MKNEVVFSDEEIMQPLRGCVFDRDFLFYNNVSPTRIFFQLHRSCIIEENVNQGFGWGSNLGRLYQAGWTCRHIYG